MTLTPGDTVTLRGGDGSQPNVSLTVERLSVNGDKVQLTRRDAFSAAPAQLLWVDRLEVVSSRAASIAFEY